MIVGVRGTSIGDGRVVAYALTPESCAESREYMLTYFLGMGTYFYWGNGSIYLLGDGSKSLRGGGGG